MEWIAKYHFDDDKLGKVIEKIKVQYVPNTEGLIQISTYT